jgi:hypothetical protein
MTSSHFVYISIHIFTFDDHTEQLSTILYVSTELVSLKLNGYSSVAYNFDTKVAVCDS